MPTLRGCFWGFVLLLALALSARGQTAAPAVPLSTPTPAGRVGIVAEQFGVGDTVRPGEFFGVRLALTDTADKPRRAAVVMHIPDDDGDTTLISRLVTLNPGQPIGLWIEGRLPAWFSPAGPPPIQFSVHEAGDDADDAIAAVRGRQIGAARIAPRRIVYSQFGLIGVIGRRTFGLDQYRLSGGGGEVLPVAHEATEIVTGLAPETLPDDWRALAGFKAIVWTEGDPIRMDGNRPQALREWVTRGGHLVIVLPPVGGAWQAGANPIADLLPAATIDRVEDASLEPYRALLTTPAHHRRVMPAKAVIQTATPATDAAPEAFIPVVRGPDGFVIWRRLVGVGMVTIIGLDLTDRTLTETGVLRADTLWHQLLGERFSIPEANAPIASMGRATITADRVIAGEISKGAAAGVGVLLGLVVFGLYWVIAGPLGFGILKARGLARHAWVAFVLTTAVFTLIAWLGATSIKMRKVEAWHLTFLDHIYGQPVQRTRTWTSVLLPDYGEATLRVGEPGVDEQWRQSITTWTEPEVDRGAISFPDARGYAVDARRPESITLPSRATIKLLQLDWVGGPRWTMISPAGPGLEPVLRRTGAGWSLDGTLSHAMPAALRDATVVLVTGPVSEQDLVNARADAKPGFLRFNSYAWSLAAPWEPGQPLVLSALKLDSAADAAKTFERWVPTFNFGVAFNPAADVSAGERVEAYNRLAFHPMLEPPDWDRPSGTINLSATRAIVARRSTHGFDLGKWFTQPSLIIVGSLTSTEMPTPLRLVEGDRLRDVPSEGRTVVRWVYPLAPGPLSVTGLNPAPTRKKPADEAKPQDAP